MPETKPSFAKRIFSNTTFAILDQISYKIGTTVAFILLVRMLPDSAIAAIGIASSYLIVIGYLDLSLVRILLRDYPKIARDHEERNLHFSAFGLFLLFQALAMACASMLMQVLVLNRLGIPGLSFLYWGMTVEFFAMVFQDWIRMVFYTDLQQPFFTRIGVAMTVLRLSAYGILLLSPTLETFIWILIGVSLFSILLWATVFTIKFRFRPKISPRLFSIIRHGLNDYGIWDHLNRMAVDTLFTVDTAILSLFILSSQVLSEYSIALKVTSLLMLIPRQLGRSLQLVLANYNEQSERYNSIQTYLKANALLSFAQLAFMVVFGKWLIFLLFGGNVDIEGIYQYAVVITIGLTILMIGFPFVSIINNFTNLRRAFLMVFLPSLILGLGTFAIASWQWGAMGLAYANIAAYSILILGMFLFIQKYYPFPMRFRLITKEEKRLLQELLRVFQ